MIVELIKHEEKMTISIKQIIEPITDAFASLMGYKKIVVLGMQEAGKTTFLCHLRKKTYVKEGTSSAPFGSFSIKLTKGKMFIDEGVDIGGGESYISQYPKLIHDADIVFFIFNSYLYVSDSTYQLKTNARLEFINRHLTPEKKVCLIGSHLDVYNEEYKNSNAVNVIRDIICDETNYPKPYRRLLDTSTNVFVATNLTIRKNVIEIISMFK